MSGARTDGGEDDAVAAVAADRVQEALRGEARRAEARWARAGVGGGWRGGAGAGEADGGGPVEGPEGRAGGVQADGEEELDERGEVAGGGSGGVEGGVSECVHFVFVQGERIPPLGDCLHCFQSNCFSSLFTIFRYTGFI